MNGRPGLEDASLVAGNRLEREPQEFLMVVRDFGDDGQQRVGQHVGRVLAAAHAGFDDADADLLEREDVEGGGGEDLKGRGIDPFEAAEALEALLDVEKRLFVNGL